MSFEYKGFSVVVSETTRIFAGNKLVHEGKMSLRFQIEAYIDWIRDFNLI